MTTVTISEATGKPLKTTFTKVKGWVFDTDTIRPDSALSPQEQLRSHFERLSQELEERHGLLDDWHPDVITLSKSFKVIFEEKPRQDQHTSDWRKPNKGKAAPARWFALCLRRKGKNYKLTQHAVRQLNKILDVPQSYINSLLSANDEDARRLLEDIYSRELSQLKSSHLLIRLENYWHKDAKATDGIVRAVLPKSFNRLDNLYMLRAFCEVLEDRPELLSGGFRLQCDGDHFRLEVSSDRHRERLTAEGDEAITGFAFRNSEIEKNSLFFEVLLIRLVCTNGMTTNDNKKFKLSSKVNRLLDTEYWDMLPPVQLPGQLQGSINAAIEKGLEEVTTGDAMVQQLGVLRRELQHLSSIPLDVDVRDRDRLRALVGEVLTMGGFRMMRGVSIDDVMEALEEERETLHGNARNSALAIFHAITRVARNFGGANQTRSEGLHGGRGRSTPRLSIAEQWELGDQMRARSRRVSHERFDWGEVKRRARRTVRKIEVPHI